MTILAHGGAAGAAAEAAFLAVPVLVFVLLSRWAKRKARVLEARDAARTDVDGRDPASTGDEDRSR